MLPAAVHILLLEDDPGVSELVLASLREAGYGSIRTSSSIAGARQCWHAQLGKFDLVITDFSLPDGCAPEFISELARYKPSLGVILMSGYSEEALGLESGLCRHLTVLQKPFMPTELLDAVTASLQSSTVC